MTVTISPLRGLRPMTSGDGRSDYLDASGKVVGREAPMGDTNSDRGKRAGDLGPGESFAFGKSGELFCARVFDVACREVYAHAAAADDDRQIRISFDHIVGAPGSVYVDGVYRDAPAPMRTTLRDVGRAAGGRTTACGGLAKFRAFVDEWRRGHPGECVSLEYAPDEFGGLRSTLLPPRFPLPAEEFVGATTWAAPDSDERIDLAALWTATWARPGDFRALRDVSAGQFVTTADVAMVCPGDYDCAPTLTCDEDGTERLDGVPTGRNLRRTPLDFAPLMDALHRGAASTPCPSCSSPRFLRKTDHGLWYCAGACGGWHGEDVRPPAAPARFAVGQRVRLRDGCAAQVMAIRRALYAGTAHRYDLALTGREEAARMGVDESAFVSDSCYK